MHTEYNKGRAKELFNSLNGTYSISDWVQVIVKVLAFLLNRYINED